MRKQTHFEEQLNASTHALGAVLGFIGLVMLMVYCSSKIPWGLFSVSIYGVSIIVLFLAS